MSTEDLIARLSRDLRPTPPGAAARRLLLAVAVGALVALTALMALLGPRADIAQAIGSSAFWMKAAYSGALALAALAALSRVARPGATGGPAWAGVFAVPLIVFALGGMELMSAPADARRALVMGHSWTVCPWRILGFSAPVFVAVIWAFRRLAPTRLRLAGFAAGLASGAVGATVYGVACSETAAAFLAVWYTLGMMIAGAVGALLGPRLLRW